MSLRESSRYAERWHKFYLHSHVCRRQRYPVNMLDTGNSVMAPGERLGRVCGASMYIALFACYFYLMSWNRIVVAEVETFTGVRSLASSEVIMPSSAASVATTVANTNLVLGEVIHSTPTTLSISSGTQLSDIGSDDSSALLEEFESESDVAEWEDIRRRDIGDHGIVDPEYVVLYDEDQSYDE